jgi:hypothetical protein
MGRPHSGTRPVAAAFSANDVYMGAGVTRGFLDSEPFFAEVAVPLLASDWFQRIPNIAHDADLQAYAEERLAAMLARYLGGFDGRARGWGWKLSESLFVMPLLRHFLPGTRFVHVIRDGRDVVLSDDGFFQLTSPARTGRTPRQMLQRFLSLLRSRDQRFVARFDYGRFCRNVTFADDRLRRWRGLDLDDPDSLRRNRFQIQMQAWVTCVECAREYKCLLPRSYVELRYEALCRDPVSEMSRVFEDLDVPLLASAREYLVKTVDGRRVEKWRQRRLSAAEERDFGAAVEVGADLLRRLGYGQ